MQNKPNFHKAHNELNSILEKELRKIFTPPNGEKQTQSKPNQTQFKANFSPNKPKQSQFKPKTNPISAQKSILRSETQIPEKHSPRSPSGEPNPLHENNLPPTRYELNGDEGNRTLIPAMRPRCAPVTPRPQYYPLNLSLTASLQTT